MDFPANSTHAKKFFFLQKTQVLHRLYRPQLAHDDTIRKAKNKYGLFGKTARRKSPLWKGLWCLWFQFWLYPEVKERQLNVARLLLFFSGKKKNFTFVHFPTQSKANHNLKGALCSFPTNKFLPSKIHNVCLESLVLVLTILLPLVLIMLTSLASLPQRLQSIVVHYIIYASRPT